MVAGAYGLYPRAVLADIPDQFDGTTFKLAAPDPNPKYGGVLRMGITNRVPHFDLHQSGTYNNLGSMGCLFDNLIRRDPRDGGKTVIPDLAHSWDIAKDRKTYTFYLRKGVQFHDGAELTSDDVKATFDRIVKPPQGISIPRSILFRAVSEVNAPDKYTIEFKLSEPRPPAFIMAAIASGWNVIVRKKTLEDNNYNLRKVASYPGTGPFKTVQTGRERDLGRGEEQGLLEQGPAVSGRHRVLQSGAVLARTRLGDSVGSRGLCARGGSGDVQEGAGHARHVGIVVQPERDPRDLCQHKEKAVRRPARATCDAPGAGSPDPDRGDQGRGADADRRLPCIRSPTWPRRRRSWSSGSAIRTIRLLPRRRRRR